MSEDELIDARRIRLDIVLSKDIPLDKISTYKAQEFLDHLAMSAACFFEDDRLKARLRFFPERPVGLDAHLEMVEVTLLESIERDDR